MKRKDLVEQLEEISYGIREFAENHIISEGVLAGEKLSDRLDNIAQKIEDEESEDKEASGA